MDLDYYGIAKIDTYSRLKLFEIKIVSNGY
jgi:hypothetical protein